MAYRIRGLPRERFSPLFGLDDSALAVQGARRVVANAGGFPCRVSLEDAAEGETLILLNHVSNDSRGPYRCAYAIYVREGATDAPTYVDRTPPVFAGRTLSLRGFTADGDLAATRLSPPDEHDAAIRALLADPRVHHIDAHNAAPGCFAARIERHAGTA